MFDSLREECGPSDTRARDGSGEGENDEVDERRIATAIGFCDCTNLSSGRERCAINSLGIVGVIGKEKEG